jgi:hypothetical protein
MDPKWNSINWDGLTVSRFSRSGTPTISFVIPFPPVLDSIAAAD